MTRSLAKRLRPLLSVSLKAPASKAWKWGFRNSIGVSSVVVGRIIPAFGGGHEAAKLPLEKSFRTAEDKELHRYRVFSPSRR
jgi:hypothetical protein